ncbi:MAG: class I SAM-dependent methyltransferase [Candidatus Wildermuthbacteria bacterium]|nr:class I SAM-dependent methyltransferase [Candidatus Wildermuthbacteria bacterium]
MINRKTVNEIALRFTWRKPVAKLLDFWWKMRSKRLAKHLLPYIPKGAHVLDIGSGSGILAKEISLYAEVQLLDVIDWNITDLPLVLFDGKRIPYADKQFDIALLVDVLHHSENEEELLREAHRVAKKVVVLEEAHDSKYMKIWANINDNLQWLLYGMPLGLHHRSKERWSAFLGGFCSEVQCHTEYFGHAIYTME